jgi:hypothetical protein
MARKTPARAGLTCAKGASRRLMAEGAAEEPLEPGKPEKAREAEGAGEMGEVDDMPDLRIRAWDGGAGLHLANV